jgi:hypothetical protein
MKPLALFLLMLFGAFQFSGQGCLAAEALSPRKMLAQIESDDPDLVSNSLIGDLPAAIVTYHLLPSQMLSFSADLEVLPDDDAGLGEATVAPQFFLAVGKDVYAGLGTGIYIQDGTYADQPFYSLRAGVDLELFPFIYLDFSADYRFKDWAFADLSEGFMLEDLALGGMLRIQF